MYNLATNLHSNSYLSHCTGRREGSFFCLNSQLMSLFGYQTIISDCLSGSRLCLSRASLFNYVDKTK